MMKVFMIRMITARKMMIIMSTNLGQLEQLLLFLLTRREQLPEKRLLNSSPPSGQDFGSAILCLLLGCS